MPQLPRVPSRVMALLLVGVLLKHFGLVPGFFRNLTDLLNPIWSSSTLTYAIVVGGFLILLTATIVGLFRGRIWGVYCAYALVPVSTILHSIPLVPFISDLLPTLDARIIALPITNLAFLIAVVVIHTRYRRTPQGGADLQPQGT